MNGLPPDLGPAAQAYLDAFPKGDVVAFPLTPLDRTGLPVWVVALFPDDPRLADIMPYGVGYGSTDAQAVLGGLGECAEMIYSVLTMPDRRRVVGSWNALVASLGRDAVVDPLLLGLPAGSAVGRGTELEWIEAKRVRDNATVLVPVDVAAVTPGELSPGYKPFATLITNGQGAGPDLDWAIGHGLLELLQRDGNGLLFKALDQGIALDLPSRPSPALAAIVDRFAVAGVRAIPKFATDEFGLANVYCVGFEADGREPPVPIMLTGCGEACHPDAERAVAKALTEFAASRARKAFAHGPGAQVDHVAPNGYPARFIAQAGGNAKGGESRSFEAMRDWTRRRPDELRQWLAGTVHAVRDHKPFADLPSTPAVDSRDAGRIARERVEAAGLDVLYVDSSPVDAPISVVKVIVPGLEVETMSYHRIGERNARKLIERDHPLIRFGSPSDTLKPVRLTPEALERFGGQPLFDTALATRIVGPLYPLYREPEAHHVAAAEAMGS